VFKIVILNWGGKKEGVNYGAPNIGSRAMSIIGKKKAELNKRGLCQEWFRVCRNRKDQGGGNWLGGKEPTRFAQ